MSNDPRKDLLDLYQQAGVKSAQAHRPFKAPLSERAIGRPSANAPTILL